MADWQDAVDLVPWAVFLAWALVAGASLWRYGTLVSTDINATCVNAWAALFVAAAALLAAWLASPHDWPYPYAVNAAELAPISAVGARAVVSAVPSARCSSRAAAVHAFPPAEAACPSASASVISRRRLPDERGNQCWPP